MKRHTREVVGIVPMSGLASRITPLPCSKEIFPIGFSNAAAKTNIRPKVASHYLLEKMRFAGIRNAYLVLRKGKWDIPAYWGDGEILDMNLAYLLMNSAYGVPYTIDQAFSFVAEHTVAFGFPDIIFQPEDDYTQLISKLDAEDADIV